MITRCSRRLVGALLGAVVWGALWAQPIPAAQDEAEPAGGELPAKVMEVLEAKFPMARVQEWTKEKEGGRVVFEIGFKQKGRTFEAEIEEDGAIIGWEKEVPVRELPAGVKRAVETRYPKSTLKKAVVVMAVKDGKDALEGYEIVVRTAGKRRVEVMVGPDGKVTEDSEDSEEDE